VTNTIYFEDFVNLPYLWYPPLADLEKKWGQWSWEPRFLVWLRLLIY